MFENRPNGIFSLLDEECRMPNPKTKSFLQKVSSQYGKGCDFFKTRTNDEFTIRHFGQDVHYTPDNFIVNNAEVHSEHLYDLIAKISKPACQDFTMDKKTTYSGTFKIELVRLIDRLKQTVMI